MEFILNEEEYWKCRNHSSQPCNGVCPTCLRNRLILLCPDCANVRPCGCCHLSSDTPSSPSSSSSLSVTGIGAVGRVSYLIDSEPAFRRSRSAAFQFLRRRSDEIRPPPPENRRKSSFWSFLRSDHTKKKKKVEEGKKAYNLSRSRSVGVFCDSFSSGDVRLKSRSWYFPSPIKVFRQPKMANIVRQRSPLCRG